MQHTKCNSEIRQSLVTILTITWRQGLYFCKTCLIYISGRNLSVACNLRDPDSWGLSNRPRPGDLSPARRAETFLSSLRTEFPRSRFILFIESVDLAIYESSVMHSVSAENFYICPRITLITCITYLLYFSLLHAPFREQLLPPM